MTTAMSALALTVTVERDRERERSKVSAAKTTLLVEVSKITLNVLLIMLVTSAVRCNQ